MPLGKDEIYLCALRNRAYSLQLSANMKLSEFGLENVPCDRPANRESAPGLPDPGPQRKLLDGRSVKARGRSFDAVPHVGAALHKGKPCGGPAWRSKHSTSATMISTLVTSSHNIAVSGGAVELERDVGVLCYRQRLLACCSSPHENVNGSHITNNPAPSCSTNDLRTNIGKELCPRKC